MAVNVRKVHIYESDDEYRVHPPVLELGSNPSGLDEIIFKNHTKDDLVVVIPKNAVGAGDPTSFILDKSGGKKQIPTFAQGGNANAFPYQVIAPKSGKKAKGNSDPVLIIEN
jgi:hypothetical protein